MIKKQNRRQKQKEEARARIRETDRKQKRMQRAPKSKSTEWQQRSRDPLYLIDSSSDSGDDDDEDDVGEDEEDNEFVADMFKRYQRKRRRHDGDDNLSSSSSSKQRELVPNPAVYRKPIQFVSSGIRIIGDKVVKSEKESSSNEINGSTGRKAQQRRPLTDEEQWESLRSGDNEPNYDREDRHEPDSDDEESPNQEMEHESDSEQEEETGGNEMRTTTVTVTQEVETAESEQQVQQSQEQKSAMLSNADFASFFTLVTPVTSVASSATLTTAVTTPTTTSSSTQLPTAKVTENEEKKAKKKQAKRKGKPAYFITESKRKMEERSIEDTLTQLNQATATKKREAPAIVAKKDKQFGEFLDDTVGNNVIKMMRNMGYDFSGGLGREGEGIVNPIKVIMTGRQQAVIISDHHIQKTQTVNKDIEEGDDRLEGVELVNKMETSTGEQRRRRWKKDLVGEARGINRKQKAVYQTAEELLSKQREKQEKTKAVPYEIIDMTGSEARVLSSLSELRVNGVTGPGGSTSKVLPELQYNIRELVGMCEASIQGLDRKIRKEKDKFTELDQQRIKLEQLTQEQERSVASFQEVLRIVSQCFDRLESRDNPLTLDTLHSVFQSIQQSYGDIYFKYDIGQCAVALAGPLIKHRFDGWNPFERPLLNRSIMTQWSQILAARPDDRKQSANEEERPRGWRRELLKQPSKIDEEDYYERLIEDVVLPRIRSAFKLTWDPVHQCDQAVTLLEQFIRPLLPEPMTKHIIDSLILPKIAHTVENDWNAFDSPLIHTWIHPWLPVLGHEYKTKMEQFDIFPAIRRKMHKSLQNWDPAEPVAHRLLSPWKPVFEPKDMNALLSQVIVPRLTSALRTRFEVDPSNQDLTTFQQVMMWSNVLPSQFMVTLLENEFFPKWNIVLYNWLCQSDKDFQQIQKWYYGWRSMFPGNVADSRKVQLQFTRAMDMINQAFSGQEIIPSHTLPAPSIVIQSRSRSPQPTAQDTSMPRTPKKQPAATEQYYELSFKELIEQFAAQNDYVFMPKEGKANGKQLYNFAGLSTYIDNDCLYLKDATSGFWKPVTLEEYLSRVEARQQEKKKKEL